MHFNLIDIALVEITENWSESSWVKWFLRGNDFCAIKYNYEVLNNVLTSNWKRRESFPRKNILIVDGKSNRKYSTSILLMFIFLQLTGNGSDRCVCYRTAPLNSHSSLSQINKRRLEIGVDIEAFRVNDRRFECIGNESSMDEEMINKRRRRLMEGEHVEDTDMLQHTFVTKLPHTMRQPEEDDESLISETQAALITLSGSWSCPVGREQTCAHSSDENDPGNDFENLFDDKRSEKMLPSSPSQSSESAEASQKSFALHGLSAENNCDSNEEDKPQTSISDREKSMDDDGHSRYSGHYDGPSFDELVDSSSNELEIDMTDRNDEKYDDESFKQKRKGEMLAVNKQSLYNAYKAATAALPFSTQSAFKPPAEVKHKIHATTFPSEPFGGYSNEHEKSSAPKVSKQYTVLQPAGAGSRAATALQEARALPSTQPARDSRVFSSLSPTPSRGALRLKGLYKLPQRPHCSIVADLSN